MPARLLTMKHNVIFFLKNHLLLISLLFFLGLAACQDEASCVSSNDNYVRIELFKIDTVEGNVADTFRNLSVSTLEGAPIHTNITTTNFILQLNPSANQVSYILQQGSITDTLQFSYEREQQIISPECGVDQRFYNLAVTQQTFDSIRVLSSDVEKFSNTANITIYTCRYSLDDTLRLRFFRENPQTSGGAERDTVHVASVVNDRGSVLYENADSLSSLLIPVYPDANQIGLSITRMLTDSTLVTDDLVLSYRKTDSLIVTNCLPQTRYDQLDTIHHTFDSLSFDSEILDRNNAGNISIFF